MKLKILLWSVVLILILGLAAGVYWWMSRPQVITFSDGGKITLLAVQYGKKHAPPIVKAPAKSGTTVTAARRGNGSFNTPADTLVIWVREQSDTSGNQFHNFQYFAYDMAGTACVQTYGRNYSGGQQGNGIVAVQLDTFPRRQGKFIVRVQENGNGGQEISDQKFVILNPERGKSFANWTAEPLPSTKSDDDVSVTLTRLEAGADAPYQRDQDNPDDAMNKGVQVAYHVESNGKPAMNWAPASLETTDATGNRTAINYGPNGGNQVQWNGDEGTFTYQYGLWPDEPAWKLRMEMTQTSDFSSDEQWTAQNIPVVPGSQQSFMGYMGGRGAVIVRGGVVTRLANPPGGDDPTPVPCAEADLGGHHIKVFPAVQFTNLLARPANLPANVAFTQPQQTGLMIQIQPALINGGPRPMNGTQPADDGLRLTLVKVTDGQGGEIQTYSSGWSSTGMGGADSTSTYRFTLRDIAGVTNITATIAIHKNRFFEFTVKPQKVATAQP